MCLILKGCNPIKLYLSLTIVFLLSFLSTWLLPVSEIIKGTLATPALLAMIGALFQLARDHATHENNLVLQRKQQIFNLGATSHMANVTFDKHVEFCEKYMSEVYNTVVTLYREAETKEALVHANNLTKLRREYSAWITAEIGKQLAPYEDALRKIGLGQGFIEATAYKAEHSANRVEKINFVHQTFCKVLNINDPENSDAHVEEINHYISEEVVKKRVRQILDIEDLIRLRKGLISEASSYINHT